MKDQESTFAIKISGPAGAGMMQAGETFSKALSRLGFFTLVYPEYPSQIRGGDNHLQIIFSSEKVYSSQKEIDLLLAFNLASYQDHLQEVKKEGWGFLSEKVGLDEIGRELGQPLVKNSAGLGFLWGLFGFKAEALKEQIRQDFGNRGKLFKLNLQAVQGGFLKARNFPKIEIFAPVKEKVINLSGNEALVKGILAAKAGFAAIYPMTPINAILTLLAKEGTVTLFRPEDEIAGIMAAIGASYAGKKAMVATSGGGFSLMVEGLGMAGMAEIPIVIVLGQRTGPSSGIPTYSSQADLQFAVNAGQGEFPRIVLAPGDLKELYQLGAEAFNLAEAYQVPVILMTDKYLAESRFSEKASELEMELKIDQGKPMSDSKDYRRYRITPNGVSPRALPGQTAFLTNSYEHDEQGFSIDDSPLRVKMMAKRMRKLANLGAGFEFFGPEKARATLVGWGSTKGVLLDFLRNQPEYNFVHFWRPWPFPELAISILKKAQKVIVVEGNYSGQMANIIEMKSKIKVERILKDDGRPFFKGEIERLIL